MKEAEVIQAIHKAFPDRADITAIGIGDDCAALRQPSALVTTDASVEHVHFDLSFMTFGDAAYRCLASNLSDVAAMGGRASAWTLAVGLRSDMEASVIQDGIEAFRACLVDHDLPDAWLVGGDVVRSPSVFMSVTVWGACQEGDRSWNPVTRAGAAHGDAIILFGHAGYAAAGLDILQKKGIAGRHGGSAASQCVVEHFCRPVALTRLGPALAEKGLVHAMMDTSDGLFTDLPRLLERSGVGAELDVGVLLDTPDAVLDAVSELCGHSAGYYRIYGGEDYGLLAAVPMKMVDYVEELAYFYRVPMLIVGKVVSSPGIRWLKNGASVDMEDHSFAHF